MIYKISKKLNSGSKTHLSIICLKVKNQFLQFAATALYYFTQEKVKNLAKSVLTTGEAEDIVKQKHAFASSTTFIVSCTGGCACVCVGRNTRKSCCNTYISLQQHHEDLQT